MNVPPIRERETTARDVGKAAPRKGCGYDGRVVAVSISEKKGTPKRNVERAKLKENFGMIGDAHAGNWHRQISLLPTESIKKMRDKGLDVGSGDFAENITMEGIDISRIRLGLQIRVGKEVLLEVSQIGKVCHHRCAIYDQAGDCIMPREGIFAKVLKGGEIKGMDPIWLLD